MTRISKRRLDDLVEREMFDQFWHSLSLLHSSTDVSAFFSDLLSETERTMLAKRFTVAVLIMRGKTAGEIIDILHVSYSMIGSVASWIKYSDTPTKKIFETIIAHTKWQKLLDRVDELLDKLPPNYRSNWQRIGKEKFQRTLERQSRAKLR